MDEPTGMRPPDHAASYPAFQCGARTFTLDDVLVAAQGLGELDRFRQTWRSRRAAAQAAAAADLAPESAAVDAALESFRYARDLVSGEECDRWLEARGLTFDDLVGGVTRRLQAELVDADAAGAPAPHDEHLFRTDALLTDDFNGWARHLARRVAVAADAGRTLADAVPLTDLWAELEAGFSAAAAAVVTPARRSQMLSAQRLGLTRVTFELAEFDSESAAREAVLCTREDDATLGATAAANAFPCRTTECFLDDLPASWAEVLISARVGEAVIPPADDENIAVVSVVSRRAPTLEDDAILERLDGLLLDQHFRELEMRHIRWLISVELVS